MTFTKPYEQDSGVSDFFWKSVGKTEYQMNRFYTEEKKNIVKQKLE